MSTKPTLGTFVDTGAAVTIDLPRLLVSKALIQANSGGGKSWALRRLLEQTAGKVQQIIIDPEGEFASLREKHDLIIAAATGGDALAHPKTAALLALRLMETQASAVIDLYDLKHRDQHEFVRLFLEALINLPKKLWHAVLVVIDEAQLFCPEKGQGESVATEAVIDIITRGRKRGMCVIAATQRIGRFHKSAAAELKNKLIGSTGLDVDVKRAAFDLGRTPKEALAMLRAIEPGHFYAFGPALHQNEPRELLVGAVETTHPKVGQRQFLAPPPPSEAIKALMPKLADLPKEAEEQARTIEDFKRELAAARRELTQARKAQPVAAPKSEASAAELRQVHADLRASNATAKRLRTAIEALMKFVVQINAIGFAKEAGVDPEALRKAIDSAVGQAMKLIDQKLETREKSLQALQREGGRLIASIQKLLGSEKEIAIAVDVKHQEPYAVHTKTPAPPPREYRGNGTAVEGVSAPQQKLLDSLAWLESKGVYPARKETLAAIAGVSPSSGGYFNNLGALRNQLHLIEYPTPGEVGFTDEGRAAARLIDDPRPVHEHWYDVVSGSERKILQALVEKHPEVIEKDALAELVNVSPTSGGYFNNLGHLRTLGAIDYPKKGSVALTKHVMPE